jgi:hypothetical protein
MRLSVDFDYKLVRTPRFNADKHRLTTSIWHEGIGRAAVACAYKLSVLDGVLRHCGGGVARYEQDRSRRKRGSTTKTLEKQGARDGRNSALQL